MNELVVIFGHDWLCNKTHATDIMEAYEELAIKCERTGINLDNISPKTLILQDENQNELCKDT